MACDVTGAPGLAGLVPKQPPRAQPQGEPRSALDRKLRREKPSVILAIAQHRVELLRTHVVDLGQDVATVAAIVGLASALRLPRIVLCEQLEIGSAAADAVARRSFRLDAILQPSSVSGRTGPRRLPGALKGRALVRLRLGRFNRHVALHKCSDRLNTSSASTAVSAQRCTA